MAIIYEFDSYAAIFLIKKLNKWLFADQGFITNLSPFFGDLSCYEIYN